MLNSIHSSIIHSSIQFEATTKQNRVPSIAQKCKTEDKLFGARIMIWWWHSSRTLKLVHRPGCHELPLTFPVSTIRYPCFHLQCRSALQLQLLQLQLVCVIWEERSSGLASPSRPSFLLSVLSIYQSINQAYGFLPQLTEEQCDCLSVVRLAVAFRTVCLCMKMKHRQSIDMLSQKISYRMMTAKSSHCDVWELMVHRGIDFRQSL